MSAGSRLPGQGSLFDEGAEGESAGLGGVGAPRWPEGLRYRPELVSAEDEAALVALAGGLPLQEARYKDYTARRRIFAFGTHPRGDVYAAHAPLAELPELLLRLREQVGRWAGIDAQAFVHVLVTEYRPGTPLGWHRDAPPYREVAGVSLGSAARMRFRPWPPARASRDDVLTLTLAPRSAYLLRGAARSRWQHSVPPVPALRYSITLRTAERGP